MEKLTLQVLGINNMQIPLDPKLIDGMWDKVFDSLSSTKNCVVVFAGQFSSELSTDSLSNQEANNIIDNLKQREYVRVCSSRMIPMPAYFSIDFDGNSGRLMELVTSRSDDSKLKNDVLLACQFAFFENDTMNSLTIPFVVSGLEDPELQFEIIEGSKTTLVYRRK